MKIIFLDIDGVIATTKQFLLSKKSKTYIKEYDVYPFDKGCVEILNEIIDRTDAQIIISSDWQMYYNLDQLKDIFKINGVSRLPLDVTGLEGDEILIEEERAYNIKNYYMKNQKLIDKYVVIDDLSLHNYIPESNFFQTKPDEGLKQCDLKNKIIKFLI
jgi:hypothetical protein